MGKLKAHCQDFLEEGGYDLGYDMSNLPDLKDFQYVLKESMDAQEYSTKKEELMKEVKEFKKEVSDLKKRYKKAKKKV